MPVYEYKCEKCEKEFEVEQRIVDPPLSECIEVGCGGVVRRQIPASTAFTLKGAGWFRDGY